MAWPTCFSFSLCVRLFVFSFVCSFARLLVSRLIVSCTVALLICCLFFISLSGSLYTFSLLQIMRNHDNGQYILLDSMKNGLFLARTHAGYSSWENGSNLMLTHLDEGDIIHVDVAAGAAVWGGRFTNFSGFRISPN